jgi:hypothetical protein
MKAANADVESQLRLEDGRKLAGPRVSQQATECHDLVSEGAPGEPDRLTGLVAFA